MKQQPSKVQPRFWWILLHTTNKFHSTIIICLLDEVWKMSSNAGSSWIDSAEHAAHILMAPIGLRHEALGRICWKEWVSDSETYVFDRFAHRWSTKCVDLKDLQEPQKCRACQGIWGRCLGNSNCVEVFDVRSKISCSWTKWYHISIDVVCASLGVTFWELTSLHILACPITQQKRTEAQTTSA